MMEAFCLLTTISSLFKAPLFFGCALREFWFRYFFVETSITSPWGSFGIIHHLCLVLPRLFLGGIRFRFFAAPAHSLVIGCILNA